MTVASMITSPALAALAMDVLGAPELNAEETWAVVQENLTSEDEEARATAQTLADHFSPESGRGVVGIVPSPLLDVEPVFFLLVATATDGDDEAASAAEDLIGGPLSGTVHLDHPDDVESFLTLLSIDGLASMLEGFAVSSEIGDPDAFLASITPDTLPPGEVEDEPSLDDLAGLDAWLEDVFGDGYESGSVFEEDDSADLYESDDYESGSEYGYW